MRAMLLVGLCAAIAIAVLACMLLMSRPGYGGPQRRYPRLELNVPVDIHTHSNKHVGETRNISQGGMLLQVSAPMSIAQPIRLKFTLPAQTAVEIPAVVSYKKGEQIGVRFDPTHYGRLDIERWIAQFEAESKLRKQARLTSQPAKP